MQILGLNYKEMMKLILTWAVIDVDGTMSNKQAVFGSDYYISIAFSFTVTFFVGLKSPKH